MSDQTTTSRSQANADYFGDLRARPRATPPRSSYIRPVQGLRDTAGDPTSPSTPRTPLLQRSLSSAFNSPGTNFKTDDDFIVLEVGSRFFRAGLGGEERPRCRLSYGPKQQLRVGDYSAILEQGKPTSVHLELDGWGHEEELWRMDLRGLDLGLVADKLERAIRTAMIDHVLVMDETKKRPLMLAIPLTLPQPLLSTMLTTFFNHYPYPPTITLLSCPLLSVVAAGQRSGLVIDIGWNETTITAVYELREIYHERTVRAMKTLSIETAKLLGGKIQTRANSQETDVSKQSITGPSLEQIEEVMHRMIWCRKSDSNHSQTSSDQTKIKIPASKDGNIKEVPFETFSEPAETALFGLGSDAKDPDIHELPVQHLAYQVLVNLSFDVRNAVLPRILLTGGGANLPGLKGRIISLLRAIIEKHGTTKFDRVHNCGSASHKIGANSASRSSSSEAAMAEDVVQVQNLVNKDVDADSKTPAYLQPALDDDILDKIRSRSGQVPVRLLSDQIPSHNDDKPPLRGISSLGPWVGASLIAGLRLKGLVEIDRDIFLQHGLFPPEKDELSKRKSAVFVQNQQQRQSLGGTIASGAGKLGERDHVGWTLGAWA